MTKAESNHEIIKGDLLRLAHRAEFDLVLHGCNCCHAMGAGIAGQIAQRFPEAYEVDREAPRYLGNYSSALILIFPYSFHVVNLYTQKFPGPYFEISALDEALRRVVDGFGKNVRIGYPRIGAGIGGGDWNEIYPLIKKRLKGVKKHTLVEYEP